MTDRLPCDAALQHACKLSLSNEKPVMLDYWKRSLSKEVCFGVRSEKEKLLVKSADEYTSPIVKIYKANTDFIVETENSLYLVDATIQTKKLS
jgi:hypothetical protein